MREYNLEVLPRIEINPATDDRTSNEVLYNILDVIIKNL
jgi:hypothetical protein